MEVSFSICFYENGFTWRFLFRQYVMMRTDLHEGFFFAMRFDDNGFSYYFAICFDANGFPLCLIDPILKVARRQEGGLANLG